MRTTASLSLLLEGEKIYTLPLKSYYSLKAKGYILSLPKSFNYYKLILIVLCLLHLSEVQSQSTEGSQLPKIIPPPPNAASLGKYAEIPVSTYTGIPNITIPLYEIMARDITVPITLNYHSSVRVEEESSWVGLGWSLNAGGLITRTIRGKEDFQYLIGNQYAMPNGRGFGFSDRCLLVIDGQEVNYEGAFSNPDFDWDPDVFYFNFLGHTGKFIFDQQGNIHLLEQQKIKIELIQVSDYNRNGFKIITEDGFQYHFFDTEVSYVSSNHSVSGVSSWYLSKISSPQGEEVTFTYDDENTWIYQLSSYSRVSLKKKQYCINDVSQFDRGSYTPASTNAIYLSKIDFRNGYIKFERDDQQREDLRGAKKLKAIQVYRKDNSLVKEYELITSYFESRPEIQLAGNYSYNLAEHSTAGKRLRLDKVIEKNTAFVKPAYTLTYNSTKLPYKTSYNKDHWGFFNGVLGGGNNSLIPAFKGIVPDYGTYEEFPGANREPDPEAVKACLLEKIEYPTGGSTAFTYESNDYGNIEEEDIYEERSRGSRAYKTSTETLTGDPFTIEKQQTPVDVIIHLRGGSPCSSPCQPQMMVYIKGVGTSFFRAWRYVDYQDGYKTERIFLNPGQYEVGVRGVEIYPQTSGVIADITAQFNVLVKVEKPLKKIGGGVRIAKITNYDGVNETNVREYNYKSTITVDGAPRESSHGILMTKPKYDRSFSLFYVWSEPDCKIFQLCSYSTVALSNSAQGSPVGYSQVEVQYGGGGQVGKTVFNYHNSQDIVVADYPRRIPSVPARSYELNGYLRSQTDYIREGASYRKVKEITKTWEVENQHVIPGIVKEQETAGRDYAFCRMPLHYYFLYSQWIQLVAQGEQVYDQNTDQNFAKTSTYYSYDTGNKGHMQLSSSVTYRSNGSKLVTEHLYPADYNGVSQGILAKMRSDNYHMHNVPIETIIKEQKGDETKVIGGTFTTYEDVDGNASDDKAIIVPTKVEVLESKQPKTTFTSSLATGTAADPTYKVKQLRKYDPSTGNIEELTPTDGVSTTYIWGYNKSYPVAEIKNATNDQVKTALNITNGNIELGAGGLSPAQESNLRAIPNAMVTTFTYQPLVGVSSQTGPDGKTLTYEYDELQRLKRVKDHHGNLVKQYEYHYKPSPTN